MSFALDVAFFWPGRRRLWCLPVWTYCCRGGGTFSGLLCIHVFFHFPIVVLIYSALCVASCENTGKAMLGQVRHVVVVSLILVTADYLAVVLPSCVCQAIHGPLTIVPWECRTELTPARPHSSPAVLPMSWRRWNGEYTKVTMACPHPSTKLGLSCALCIAALTTPACGWCWMSDCRMMCWLVRRCWTIPF